MNLDSKNNYEADALTTYKASAGSGKTFRLALEYIKFLAQDPERFRNILAVTFTNKATDEMKMRILATLYGIVRGLHDSQQYLDMACKELYKTEDDVRSAAAIALQCLIHNYDYFHVETIDSFFQSILRNLAKELDLAANMRVELNGLQIENQAVEQMVEDLNDKSALFKWLIKNVLENIDNGKDWNIVKSAKNFGKMIFDDEYQEISQQLEKLFHEEGSVEKLKREIRAQEKTVKTELQSCIDEYKAILQRTGILEDDFKAGRSGGIKKYMANLLTTGIQKLDYQQKNVENLKFDVESWANDKNGSSPIIRNIFSDTLLPFFERTENKRREAIKILQSIAVTLDNLDNLKLLGDIEHKMKDMNAEANRFLLSDTQRLLSSMVGETDTPFIFEKIGTRLQHIMIDEFQDTSAVQWNNFRILLHETMSKMLPHPVPVGANTEYLKFVNNLIVGDIKQSIYRWRGGDWRLLTDESLTKSFGHGFNIGSVKMKENYRSLRNIVLFNNAFFKVAIQKEAQHEEEVNPAMAADIRNAYADVQQIPMKTANKGMVRIKLLPQEDLVESMLQETLETLKEILAQGTRPKNVAILLRTNARIGLLADYLHRELPELNVVSDEAFRLDYAVSTNCIVLALKLLYQPEDKIALGLLSKYYLQNIKHITEADHQLYTADQWALLPNEFSQKTDELKQLPLYDLCETIYSIFSLDQLKDESAYVCAFFDYLTAYINDMSANPLGFVEEWENSLSSKTIQTDDVDGVRLLTINKSKGLEFDNVILPFCNWPLEKFTDNLIWCSTNVAPFNRIPLIPITYSPKLKDTVYATDYLREHTQNTIDNLNLLYVAFTRPKKNMFVLGQRALGRNATRSRLIKESLQDVVQDETLAGATLTGLDDEEQALTFEYGQFEPSPLEEEKETANVFLKTDKAQHVDIQTNRWTMQFMADGITSDEDSKRDEKEEPQGRRIVDFRQSNSSKRFIEELDDEDDNTPKTDFIKEGNIMHQVFAEIRTTDDIAMVLNRYEANGILPGANLDRNKIEQNLRRAIEGNPLVADWFTPHWTLFNECSIICTGDDGKVTTLRPDRVMKDGERVVVVDFKFGRRPLDKYIEQVKTYISLLKEMGYPNVDGYLWFIKLGKVQHVEL